MRDEYLIRNTHRTFRAWLYLLALSEDNLNAISCISESLKGKLSLEAVRSNTLMIKTFGSTSEQIQECPLIECIVNSRHENSALCINAYVVPTICAPLNGQIINSAKQEYTHQKGLRLAEEARDEEELQVDVLIGADH
jgi:hypothetical protein